MKQEVYPSKMSVYRNRDKAIRETGFFKHMSKIFQDYLNVEFWTDEDPDGKSGGVDFELFYETDTETIEIKNGEIEVISYKDAADEEGEETLLSKEQLEAINLLLWEFEQEEGEHQADADYYNKVGEYRYNGVSIRDFI